MSGHCKLQGRETKKNPPIEPIRVPLYDASPLLNENLKDEICSLCTDISDERIRGEEGKLYFHLVWLCFLGKRRKRGRGFDPPEFRSFFFFFF